jgi:hypothetical protein
MKYDSAHNLLFAFARDKELSFSKCDIDTANCEMTTCNLKGSIFGLAFSPLRRHRYLKLQLLSFQHVLQRHLNQQRVGDAKLAGDFYHAI